jgi:hypothetical protein
MELRRIRRFLLSAVKVVATVVIAVVLFPFETIITILGGGNEVGIASAAIRSLWRPDVGAKRSGSSDV